jgi:CspA family cold shock protein
MQDSAVRVVTGQVKWFDPDKGFGFVVAEDVGPDILLHANVLRNFGQSSVAEGAVVEMVLQDTARGVQAVEILSITPPVVAPTSVLADFESLTDIDIENHPLTPARVKWFDKSKGFGFANVFGNAEDVFIHVEVLRRSGLSELQPGEALAVRVMDGQRGKMAMQICAWETVLK